MFKELRLIDENISQIQNELKSSFVKPETLTVLAKQLDEIHAFIKRMDSPDEGPFFRKELEKHKAALIDLFGRWQTLFVDAQVTEIAEDAQQLSESEGCEEQLKALSATIQDLCIDEALSIENQLMITLARRFIAKGLNLLEELPDLSEPLSDIEVAEATTLLFEIASDLYDGNVKRGLNLVTNLSEDLKQGVFSHFNRLDGNLDVIFGADFKAVRLHTFKMIQALLAHIKELAQNVPETTYADEATVDALFQAME